MKKLLISILLVLFGFVLMAQTDIEKRNVRAYKNVKADSMLTIGRGNDTIRSTTQMSSADDTLVTKKWARDSIGMFGNAYLVDSNYIKTAIREWDGSVAKDITESDTTRWGLGAGFEETDPFYSNDSSYIKETLQTLIDTLANYPKKSIIIYKTIPVTSTYVSVNYGVTMTNPSYRFTAYAWYNGTSGFTYNGIYDLDTTSTGFTCRVNSPQGYLFYEAMDTASFLSTEGGWPETDPVYAGDSANILHWSDTTLATGVVSKYYYATNTPIPPAGGYANNLYFDTLTSNVSGYKTLTYTPSVTQVIEAKTINASEGNKLIEEYIYPSGVATNLFPSGLWSFQFYGRVNSASGVTKIGVEYLARHTNNTETSLFTVWSNEIDILTYDWIKFQVSNPSYTVDSTDRMVAKIYLQTTRITDVTVNYYIGDGYGAYLNNPNKIRHSQLRDLNGDSNYLHVTSGNVATWNNKADTINQKFTGYIDIVGHLRMNGDTILRIPNFDESLVIGNGGNNLTSSPPNPLTLPGANGLNNGKYNTFIGFNTGINCTSGNFNTFIGNSVGINNTIGDQNTFVGSLAGRDNTTGYHCTYIGVGAGQAAITGYHNTYVGTDAGLQDKYGNYNCFFGSGTGGLEDSIGSNNSFFGGICGRYNKADNNSFFGSLCGAVNTTGTANSFFGQSSGAANTTASGNSFFGTASGEANTGENNTYIGYASAKLGTTSKWNVGVGVRSLYNLTSGNQNAAIGENAGRSITSGYQNVFIGRSAGYHASQKVDVGNSIAIGYNAFTTDNNQMILGNTDITKTTIYGNVGIGTTTPYHKTSIHGTTATTLNLFNATNATINKITTNATTASDTSAVYVNSTTTGSMIFGIKNKAGAQQFISDSTKTQTNVPLYFVGTYAGIYVADASTAQSIPTGTTYTKSTAFTTNGSSSNCTSDAANDKITITKTGHYLVNCPVSFSGASPSVNWKMAAFWNGVEQPQIHVQRKIGTGGDVGSTTMTGILNVTSVPTDLDVRFRHDQAGSENITVVYSNLTVTYIGE